MGAVSNVLPAQRGLYVVIGAKLSRFQSRLRVYNIYLRTVRVLSDLRGYSGKGGGWW